MPREAISRPLFRVNSTLRLSPDWRSALIRLGSACAVLVAMFLSDWAAMAAQWWNSSTYNHILLIPAIVAWLVQQRLPQLGRIAPAIFWPGLVLAAGATLIWMLGAFSALDTARQLGAVTLLIAATVTLLGVRASAALVFPLGYTLFLVPIGDEFVPFLQTMTARITIRLVELSGVPAAIDGVFIHTPAGLFEVAEACSGARFLVAMIAFGVLVANVCFVSGFRRAIFLAVSIAMPILANGVRAWGTIYAAQFYGVEAVMGFDHILYGWIFFALVMMVTLLGAWRFFDRPAGDPLIDAERINGRPFLARLDALRIGLVPALAGLALIPLGGQVWARAADALSAQVPRQIFLPDIAGWQRIDYAPAVWWEPRASGADHRLLGRYADGAGREVDVFLAVYSAQAEGHEAGGFGQGALPGDGSWSWRSPGPAIGGAKSDRLRAAGGVERVALTWYRTGDVLTGSNVRLKLANMEDRLALRARPTMVLILSAEERPGRPAAQSLVAFRRAAGPLGEWMDRVAGVR